MMNFLASRFARVLARVVLTFVFWSAALAKLIGFNEGVAEMAHFGLNPPAVFNVAVIVVLLVGSALVIFDVFAWLGAGILIVFTALTIPIAHNFWTMSGPVRLAEFHVVMEHISLIGGLMVVACMSAMQRRVR
ncbi:DoxX family protein [Uliginosibacterium sp. sgz301328]|uniref:DoxX family protein n=1 Tax=Uliginosibacterium sp. sgz301328 TaxID=3243764 RepID=UPI00359D46E8